MNSLLLSASTPLALAVLGRRSVIRTGSRFAVGVTSRGREVYAVGVVLRDLPYGVTLVRASQKAEDVPERLRQLAAFAAIDPASLVDVTLKLAVDEECDSIFDSSFFRTVLADLGQPGWDKAKAASEALWQGSAKTEEDGFRADEARDEMLLAFGDEDARQWVRDRREARVEVAVSGW